MDIRVIIGVTVGLVLVAFGGFYFALSSKSRGTFVPPPPVATAQKQPAAAPSAAPPPAQPATPAPVAPPAAQPPAAARVPATPESIESEIAHSDQAELQALLKKNFPKEYGDLIAIAVKRRNEGVSDQEFGEEMFSHFQDIMRSKLKYAVGASTASIDRLAINEANLFHALGTEGASLCLKMLGKDTSPAQGPPPESVRTMMRLGTLYRFQAIVEGMPDLKTVDPLSVDDMTVFQASLAQNGLNLEEVRSGAFLAKGGNEPGKPCLMLETLYRAIARLPESTRRKIYSGMFFLGRDK
jgi:hypothetical protein